MIKWFLLLTFVILIAEVKAQTDTATISIVNNNKQYYIRIGYNPNQVDSAIRVRKFDTSYSPSRGVEVRYKDDIIKYYTGDAVVYMADGGGLKKQRSLVKVYLPIDYPDNNKFINYLRRKLFK